jgi:pimeloyl-ACP methyl ester carboxylesterase
MTTLHLARHEPGGDPILLLLHGLGATGQVWDRLLERHWEGEVIAPDLPGHGRSPRLDTYTFESMAASVAAVLPEGRKVVVLGHSLGGVLALTLAAAGRVAAACGVGIKLRWSESELARAAGLAARPERVFATREQAVNRWLTVSGLAGLVAPDSPLVDAGVLAPDARIPAPKASALAPDLTAFAPDATVPAPDATVPAPDATVPAPDATVPAPDATDSAPDATVPVPDATRPTPDATAFAPDATAFAPDVAGRAPDATAFAPDATVSAPGVTAFAPDVTVPAPDAIVPASDAGWRVAIDPAAFGVGAPNVPALLARATCPTILAAGERDPMCPPEHLLDAAPDGVVLPRAGHNVHVESPELLWPILDRLLLSVTDALGR